MKPLCFADDPLRARWRVRSPPSSSSAARTRLPPVTAQRLIDLDDAGEIGALPEPSAARRCGRR